LAFIGCGQEGPASAAGRGAVQGFAACGGAQRSSPTGAAANGMLRKTLAGPSETPTSGPESIFAIGAGWAWAAPATKAAATSSIEIRIIASFSPGQPPISSGPSGGRLTGSRQ